MSTWRLLEPYRCHQNCTPIGCPGHVMQVEFAYTSETVAVTLHDQRIVMDRAAWDALRTIADRERRWPRGG